jgi:hypothetical protein
MPLAADKGEACIHNIDRNEHGRWECRRDIHRALPMIPGVNPTDWRPSELRRSFVSVLSDAGVPVEEISRMVDHSGTTVT